MRKGDKAVIIFDKRGDIFAISTGSDACAEHEWGSKPMQDALSGDNVGQVLPEGLVASAGVALGLVKTKLNEDQLISAIRAGKKVEFLPLQERKGLRQNLDKLVFVRGEENGEPVGVFGFAVRYVENVVKLDHRELTFWREQEVVGAWDDESFAWKVRGKRLVDKLERFAKKMKDGDGMFAGTFLQEVQKENLAGVMLAVKSSIRPEHKVAIAAAQTKWEGERRLKAMSRVDELHRIYREHQKENSNARLPGHISPYWKGNVVDSEVQYRLNPNHGVDASYGGPYTFEQLRDWIVADKKTPLRPIPAVSETPAGV